jgi:hypothetical protein
MIVVMLHWDQFRAPSWVIELKREPLPPRYIIAVLAPILLFQGTLLLEELIRAWRWGGTSRIQRPANAAARRNFR